MREWIGQVEPERAPKFDKELDKDSVCSKMEHTAWEGKT